MRRRTDSAALIALAIAGAIAAANAQPYPFLEPVVNRVLQKYRTSTCQQLVADKAAPPSDIQKRAVQRMQQDPQLRAAFINQVAAPIANKLFECGMIP